jgi:hypothetical protein
MKEEQLELFPKVVNIVNEDEGIIRGERITNKVSIDGKLLYPIKSQAIINHSPDGFSWGFAGSGPAQLALGILLELYGEEIAKDLYQDFKDEIIANLAISGDFIINIESVKVWVDTKLKGRQGSNNTQQLGNDD